MDNNTLIGRIFGQQTTATRLENGAWRLHVAIKEQVTYTNGETKEETIETECVDADFDVAHQIALRSALSELSDLVYSRDMDSLVEAREYDRSLEAGIDPTYFNEDTPTQ